MINVLDEVILRDGTKGYIKRLYGRYADVITSAKDPVIQRTDLIADMKVVGHLDYDPTTYKGETNNHWRNQNIANWNQKKMNEKLGVKKKAHKQYKTPAKERGYVNTHVCQYSDHTGQDLRKLIKGSNVPLVKIAKSMGLRNASNISKIYKRDLVTKDMWTRINLAIDNLQKEKANE